MTRFTLTAALALLAFPAAAHDYRIADLRIDHPIAYETPATARAGGGYMTIVNEGEAADRLLEIRAGFPRVEMHETTLTDGIARMRPVGAVEIPAGGTVAFAPGGLHVMFLGLDGDPFEAGETIPATLVFERAGEVEIQFNVEARGAAASGHDGAGHGAVHDQHDMPDHDMPVHGAHAD